MSLEITGKLMKLLPVVTGTKQDGGTWQKQDAIIETNEQHPKTIAVTCWGDRVGEVQRVAIGSELKVSINVESREYNDKYYTDVKAWKIEVLNGAVAQATTPDKVGDLPF